MRSFDRTLRLALWLAAAPCVFAAQARAQPPVTICQATSTATPPTVLELYTSEGCSSCPPADRWLSSLKGRSDVLALAFHVTYWDRLGWPDRFALPEGTARQHQLAQLAGSRQVYTPQVVANGKDWPQWHRSAARGPLAALAATPITIKLQRYGQQVAAEVGALPGRPAGTPDTLSGYWAVLEDQHESKVRAGENAGETLRHDHVVRLYKPVPNWAAEKGASLQVNVGPGSPANPRRTVFVVTDPATQRPVQAVALGC